MTARSTTCGFCGPPLWPLVTAAHAEEQFESDAANERSQLLRLPHDERMEECSLHRRYELARETSVATQTGRDHYLQISDAIARENKIKGWSRAKKNALVESKNPQWQDLAATWYAA